LSEGLGQAICSLLENWITFQTEENGGFSLKEYISAVEMFTGTKNWEQDRKLLRLLVKCAREHGGRKDPDADAKELYRIARKLEKRILEKEDILRVMELYQQAWQLWTQAGNPVRSRKALRPALALNLFLNDPRPEAFEIQVYGGSDAEKRQEEKKEEWGLLYYEEEGADPASVIKGTVNLYKKDIRGTHGEIQRYSYEQVCADPIPFLEAVGELKLLPRYQAVVTYLLEISRLDISRAVRKQLLEYIDNGFCASDDSWPISGEMLKKLLEKLSEMTRNMYEENGFVLDLRRFASWEEYFRGMLLSFSESYLRDLALGSHMSLRYLELFLKKVLKRSGLNLCKPDEAFLYLTLAYSEKAGYHRWFESYARLRKLYSPASRKKRDLAEDYCPEQFWGQQASGRNLSGMLTEAAESRKDIKNLFEKTNPKLLQYFDVLYRLKNEVRKRNAETVFYEQADRLRRLLLEDKDFLEFRESREFERYQSKLYERNKKTVEIICRTDDEILIKKGDRFTCPVRVGKKVENAVFCVTEDILFGKNIPDAAVVSVRALTQDCVLDAYKAAKGLKVRPKLVKKQHVEKADFVLEERERSSGVEGIVLPEEASALAFVKSGDKGRGKLKVFGKAGTVLEAGSHIFLKELVGEQEFCFDYEVKEETRLERRTLVSLQWENGDELWERLDVKDGRQIAPSQTRLTALGEDTVRRTRSLTLALKKPLSICRPTAEDGISSKENEELTLCRYEEKLKKSKRSGRIRGRSEEKAAMPKISNLELLEYLYRAPADSVEYYRGISGKDRRYLLNSQAFLDTRLKNDILDHFRRQDEMRCRSLILTVLFINYVIELEHESGKSNRQFPIDWIWADFEAEVESVMEQCGMEGFNLENPYDAFLEILLACEEPLELYREIWSRESVFREMHFS